MDFTALKTELNIRLGDTNDFAYTPEEKTSILTEAVNDAYVIKTVRDTSLTYSTGTFSYAVPTGVTTVKDIYIAASSTDAAEKVQLPWEVINRTIYFRGGSDVIPDGTTLEIRSNYKYTVSDTIAETNIQEYVLNNAQYIALKKLGLQRALKFLKNDTTLSEIVALRRELEREVSSYRARLPKEYEAA